MADDAQEPLLVVDLQSCSLVSPGVQAQARDELATKLRQASQSFREGRHTEDGGATGAAAAMLAVNRFVLRVAPEVKDLLHPLTIAIVALAERADGGVVDPMFRSRNRRGRKLSLLNGPVRQAAAASVTILMSSGQLEDQAEIRVSVLLKRLSIGARPKSIGNWRSSILEKLSADFAPSRIPTLTPAEVALYVKLVRYWEQNRNTLHADTYVRKILGRSLLKDIVARPR